MDRRERYDDPQVALHVALDSWQASVWTALQGIVESFDPDAMTCVIQPAHMAQVMDEQGNVTLQPLPLLLDCPVQFQGGGGCTLTFMPKKGDEALVIFASRCIDSWWQHGGVQPPAEFRMHDLSDGYALVGNRSQPRVLPDIADAAQLRSDDGSTYVEVNASASTATMLAPGGSVHVSPDGVAITGVLVINGTPYLAHHHSGVQTGGGNTGDVVT